MDKKDLNIHELRRDILGKDLSYGDLAQGTAVNELSVDPLTGLLPRSLWLGQMNQFYEYARRVKIKFAIAIMDIDNFRDYNNQKGHPEGDKVLERLGQCIRNRFREADIKGRYGGDEMIVMLTEFNLEDSQLEKEEKILTEDLIGTSKIGISLGIAKWDGKEGLNELIKRADERLYIIKNEKKNE